MAKEFTPTTFVSKETRKRRIKVNKMINDTIAAKSITAVRSHHGYVDVGLKGTPLNKSAGEIVSEHIQSVIDRQTKSGAVKITESNETRNLEGIDQRRAKAAIFVKKYWKSYHEFRSMLYHIRKKPLTEKQIEIIEKIMNGRFEREKKLGEKK